MRTVVLAPDLMDRSRLAAGLPGLAAVRVPAECAGADVVLVDLARHADAVAAVRAAAPESRIVAYGPHVDEEAMTAARAAGADLAWPRSRLLRDPAGAVAAATTGMGACRDEPERGPGK